MMERKIYQAFTTRSGSYAHQLRSEIIVVESNQESNHSKVIGIWDTGATGSVISRRLAQKLNLFPIGKTYTRGVHGIAQVDQYLVNVVLPNKVIIEGVAVTESEHFEDFDVLIGMDLILMGDFTISNFNQKTTFSFAVPSMGEIDLIPKAEKLNGTTPVNRAERRRLKK